MTYYLDNTVPFITSVNSSVDVYPVAFISTPMGNTVRLQLNKHVSYVNGGSSSSILDSKVYSASFHPSELGAYFYVLRVFDDVNFSTSGDIGTAHDITDKLCCECDGHSTFSIIRNPIDEIVSGHQIPGSVGYTLQTILASLSLHANNGSGSCSHTIVMDNYQAGKAYTAFVLDCNGTEVAKAPVLNNGTVTFLLDEGKYQVIIRENNCSDAKNKQIIKNIYVSCSDTNCTTGCNSCNGQYK